MRVPSFLPCWAAHSRPFLRTCRRRRKKKRGLMKVIHHSNLFSGGRRGWRHELHICPFWQEANAKGSPSIQQDLRLSLKIDFFVAKYINRQIYHLAPNSDFLLFPPSFSFRLDRCDSGGNIKKEGKGKEGRKKGKRKEEDKQA